MLVVEQNVERALRIGDWAYVMSRGEIALEGPANELSRSEVEIAYMGKMSPIRAETLDGGTPEHSAEEVSTSTRVAEERSW